MEITSKLLSNILAEKDLPKIEGFINLIFNSDYEKIEDINKLLPIVFCKRILLVKELNTGFYYLAINNMGSHLTNEGKMENLKYCLKYWD